jgi:hypothetical protein
MAEAQPIAASKTSSLGQARIAGRVESVRRKTSQNGTIWLTLLAMPAPDRYSHPSIVEVVSGDRLGAQGDEVSILVSISGYARTVQPKDPKEDSYRTADTRLSFVGHA